MESRSGRRGKHASNGVDAAEAAPEGASWLSRLDPMTPTVEAHGLLVAQLEAAVPGARVLIVALDPETDRLTVLPPHRLPEPWLQAIEQLAPRPDLGSCPRAVALDRRILTSDILLDPHWEPLRGLALECGLRACWSEPMHDALGRVIGAMSLYFDTPREPEAVALAQLEGGARVAAITLSLQRAAQAEHDILEADQAAVRVLSRFIGDGDLRRHAEEMVDELRALTRSEHGILVEAVRGAAGQLRLRALALSAQPWDEASSELYRQYTGDGLYIDNLDSLLGRPVASGETIIANEPAEHADWAGSLPASHFPLRNFLGLPLRHEGEVIGMIGLANRDGGYTPGLLRRLQPVLAACTGMVLWLRAEASRARAERRVEEERARLRGVLDSLPDPVAIKSTDGVYLECNPVFADLIGMRPDQVIGHRTHELFPEETAQRFQRDDREVLESGQLVTTLRWQPAREGRRARLMHVHKLPLRDPAGRISGLLMAARDVSDIHLHGERERLAAQVFASASEGLAVTDAAGRLVSLNPALLGLLGGASESELEGRSWHVLDRGAADVGEALPEVPPEGERGESWITAMDGRRSPVWRSVTAVRNEEGSITHYVLGFLNIADLVSAREHLDHLAHHDPLTGLPNRMLLMKELARALGRARFSRAGVAVHFLDLDGFKTVNDSLGHGVGDQLLKAVAYRLRHQLRETDIVARLGGDEFVLLQEGVRDARIAESVAEKVLAAFAEPFEAGEHRLHLSPSIGISLHPDDGEDVETLLRNADTAMYAAKAAGRNGYRFYSRELTEAAATRLGLDNALRVALQQAEFQLAFQPILDLRSGRVLAAEILLRWHSGSLGAVSPVGFIPVAEATGLIVPIGDWVLEQTLSQAAAWQAAGHTLPRLAVNVSVRQLERHGFADSVLARLQRHGISPWTLEVEVTEGVLSQAGDSGRVVEQLQQLRQAGVAVAIDDFGTGYSSLARLQSLPLDRIKIDRGFLLDTQSQQSLAIARAITAIATELGLALTAEGVETEDQAALARELGCDEAQGWLFGRPCSPEDFALLAFGVRSSGAP